MKSDFPFFHIRLDVNGSAMDCPETHPSIGRVRVIRIWKLLTLGGAVTRSEPIKILAREREHECSKMLAQVLRFFQSWTRKTQ